MPKTNKPGGSTPGQRLAALRDSGTSVAERTRQKVRTKWIVVDKAELPEVIHSEVRVMFLVKLRPVFEGRPVHNGMAYVQGNADNRIFGDGRPEAEITLKLASKAIADTFVTGCAAIVDIAVDPGKDL